MKPWLVLMSLLFCAPAFASGKLTLKPQQDLDDGQIKYSLGLSVHELIAGPLFYKAWVGAGDDSSDHANDWWKMDNGLAVYVGHLALGAGVSYTAAVNNDWDKAQAYVEASLQLW